jgi:outer membrane protein assembly factor BamB
MVNFVHWHAMKKEMIVGLIIAVLITTYFYPTALDSSPGSVNSVNDSPQAPNSLAGGAAGAPLNDASNWPMFRKDAIQIANSTSSAPDTNNVLWTYNTTNSATGNGVYSSPAIVDGKVYIGSGESRLFCLNATDGKHIWNYTMWPSGGGHGQSCSPAVADGKVFIGNDFVPRLVCINATTGSVTWTFSTGGSMMQGIYSSPTVVNGRVYIGTLNRKVYCLPQNDPNSNGQIASGEIIWQKTMPDEIWSSPAVVNDRVYVGLGKDGGSNQFYCLNADTGATIWTYPPSGTILDVVSSPAIHDGQVFFGSENGNVYCLNAATGAFNWSYPIGSTIWSSPAIAYGRLFIGADDTKLHCLDLATRNEIWSYSTSGEIWSSPSVADGKVYFGSVDGRVYCLNATANRAVKIWDYFVSAKTYGICSSPSIALGNVYVGGVDPSTPKIYCFGNPPPTIDYILIRDGPDGGGANLCDPANYPRHPVGGSSTFYGGLYNHTAGFVGAVPAASSWSSSIPTVVDASSPGASSTITCSDTNSGMATITLDDGLGHQNTTQVTVLAPTVDYVQIRDGTDDRSTNLSDPGRLFYHILRRGAQSHSGSRRSGSSDLDLGQR